MRPARVRVAAGSAKKRSSSGALEGPDGADSASAPAGTSNAATLISNLVQVSNIHGQLQRLRSGLREKGGSSGGGSGSGLGSSGPSPTLTLMASPTFQRRMSLGGSRRSELACDGEGEDEGEEGCSSGGRRRSSMSRSNSMEFKRSRAGVESTGGGGSSSGKPKGPAGEQDRNSHGRQKRPSLGAPAPRKSFTGGEKPTS